MPVRITPDEHGKATQAVACGDDAPFAVHQQQRERSVDDTLRESDAVDEVVFLVDHQRDELGGVYRAGAAGHELLAAAGEVLLDELFGIVDDADRRKGERAQMAAHDKRLRVGVADAADAGIAGEVGQVIFEARAERGVRNRVDFALEALLLVVKYEACRHPEEHVQYHVVMRCRAEESAHVNPLLPAISTALRSIRDACASLVKKSAV